MKFGVIVLLGVVITSSYGYRVVPLEIREQSSFLTHVVIHGLFEKLRMTPLNGKFGKDILRLDSYFFEKGDFDYKGEIFSLKANFRSGILSGLGDVELKKMCFNKDDLSISLRFNCPKLTLKAENYKMEGNIKEAIPIKGNGYFFFEVHDLDISITVIVKQSDDGRSVVIDRFDQPEFSVRRVVSEIEFDSNIDDILNAMLSDLLPDYITRFNRAMAAAFTDGLKEQLNPWLNEIDSWPYFENILNKD